MNSVSTTALSLYARMARVRLVEEAIAEEYVKQEMKCPVHLYIGQEAVAAGVSECLTSADLLISTHRSHGHYLAKEGALAPFFAELYGKAGGSSRGFGGSMHLLDLDIGYLGSSAIVGGNIPMVAGLALAIQYRNQNNLAVAYLGDGAAEEGVLFETLNFAVLKKLPILFVCENNLFATLTRLEERQLSSDIYKKCAGFGLPCKVVDGNDVEAIYEATLLATHHIRAQEGPYFIEAKTYRWRAHCGPQWDAPSEARPAEELAIWKKKCPLASYKAKLLERGISKASLLAIEEKIQTEIIEAFAFAKASPFPSTENMGAHVYG